MRILVTAALLCWCLGLHSALVSGQSRGAPPRAITIEADSVILDISLAELLRDADAVMVARVVKRVGTRVLDYRPELQKADPGLVLREPFLQVFTDYDVTAIELLKNYPRFAFTSVFRVATLGGVGQYRDVTVTYDSGTPQLVEGGSYLLLLTFSDWLNGMTFNVNQVFDLNGPRVDASARLRPSPPGKELVGRSPQEALQRVKSILGNR